MLCASVLIPVFNGERFIEQAVDSALSQTQQPAEVVVIDDGSQVDTPRLLERYSGRVRVVRQENSGLSAARNRAAQEAHGDIFAFLDADDVWLPTKLEQQLAGLRDHAECGLAICGQVQTDECLNRIRVQPFESGGDLLARMLRFDTGIIVGGSTMLVHRATFSALGGFDLRLSTSADWDFFCRAAAGWPIHVVPEPLVLYRLHSGGMHRNVRLMEHDMTIAIAKLMQQLPPEQRRRLQRGAFADLFAVLAASYAAAGEYPSALRCLFRSVGYHPLPPARRVLHRWRKLTGTLVGCASTG